MSGGGIVFFDGGCGLCHRAVAWLARRDREGVLRFAPLEGETFRVRFPEEEARRTFPDSLVYAVPGQKVLFRTDALIGGLRRLGRGPSLLATLLALVPRPVRDRCYDAVARMRRRLFARPEGSCPRLSAAAASRFLP